MKILQLNELHEVQSTSDWIAFDLETTGLNPKEDRILLVSITTDIDTYVIDCIQGDIQQLKQLKQLFHSHLVIGMNITFDYKFWYYHTGIEIPSMYDVMVIEQVLYAGKYLPPSPKPFTLEAIAQRRLGLNLDKETRQEFINFNGSVSEKAFLYAGEDTRVLKPIYDQQIQEVKDHNLEYTCDLECSLLPATTFLELSGVLIDRDRLESLIPIFERYVQTCERVLQDMFIANGTADTIVLDDHYYCLNISSKDQIKQALNAVGVDVTSLNAKDLAKWDLKKNKQTLEGIYKLITEDELDIAEAIERFGGYSNPYLRAYNFYVGAEKLLSSYVYGILEKIQEDGRFYPWFRQCGARSTGRYSSNAQQIPKDDKLQRLGIKGSIRNCYIAPPDHSLLIADYSAIELVILAECSNDDRLIKEHLEGDLHLVVTQNVMGVFWPIAREITAENKGKSPYKLLRNFSKTLSYGIAYGVTGKSLSEQANTMLASLGLTLTSEQGDTAVQLWKQTFQGAGKFLDESASMAVTKGYTTSLTGRKRWYDLDYINSNKWARLAAMREGSNQRIQSTSADITKRAMLYLYRLLDKRFARMILTVHDELVTESHDSYVDIAGQAMKYAMERAAIEILPRMGKTVIIDPSVSKRYDK